MAHRKLLTVSILAVALTLGSLMSCGSGAPTPSPATATHASTPAPTATVRPPTSAPAATAIPIPTATLPVASPAQSPTRPLPTPAPSPTLPAPTPTPVAPLAETVLRGLDVPWSLAFLPDGSLLFTERPGRVRLADPKLVLRPEPVLIVPDVAAQGEGGLLGLALHPGVVGNGLVYLHYTYRSGLGLANRVVRYRLQGASMTDRTVIIEGIPGNTIHDGGRIKFGPDGLLYVAAGDSASQDLAQDRASLAGKILRLKDDGSIPPDNPFPGSPVYSYGHRNPEGLAWDGQGRLWETEHGSSATDEVNLVKPGANYGWPVIRGAQTAPGMESPALQSGSDTWAPTGMAFLNGSLYFGGLRGQSLFRIRLDSSPLALDRYFNGVYGRLRDVVAGPDGLLYLFTNNRDGRGSPTTEDDRLIRINPNLLLQ